MTKRPFPSKGNKVNDKLELIHSDLCGPMNIQARETANYILNLVSSKFVPLTPIQLWTGHKPSLKHVRVWGCPAHVLKGKTEKLEPKTEVCVFIGCPKGTKGGMFYNPKEKKVIVTTNAKFLEKDFLANHIHRSKLVLQELSKEITNLSTENNGNQIQTPYVGVNIPLHGSSGRDVNKRIIPQVQVPENSLHQGSGSNNEQIVLEEEIADISAPQGAEDNMDTQDPTNDVVPPQDHNNANISEPTPATVVSRRSGIVLRKPLRYALLGESFDRIPEESNIEPVNYDEALQDEDAEKWIVAMKSEMESMYSNKVWDLVEPHVDGVKPIGCKWIYKKKRGVVGKVQTYKARLVAKGFTQKEGIDYEETFSQVVMLKSIKCYIK
uniref:Polyprotein, putative n=1 Tax=Solanum demissum TaxID=50514 RepID=Q0KIL4_SOLDE|nr:Polyprotein, putative [Solanum demissum]